MEAARHRLDRLAGAGGERLDLGEPERGGRVRDGEHLRPRVPLARRSTRATARQMSPSATRASAFARRRTSRTSGHASRPSTAATIAQIQTWPLCQSHTIPSTSSDSHGSATASDQQRLRPDSAAAVCRISCALSGCALGAFRLPQSRRKPVRKRAAHLLGGSSQATPLIGQPDACRLADADRHRESRRRIERPGGHRADHRNELEHFAQTISQRPPGKRTAADRSAELCEGAAASTPRRSELASARSINRDHAGKTADPDDRDRNGAGAGGGRAVAIDQRTRLRADPVALGVGVGAVQRLERDRARLSSRTCHNISSP